MILLDVNVLVTAHREDAEHHREIKSWLESVLREPAGVAVSELALSGSLRVITHPKIFKRPTPLAQALEFVEDLRSRDEVHLLGPGAAHCLRRTTTALAFLVAEKTAPADDSAIAT
jgi:toxin-antitoxin system PIN domain toxin